MTIFLVGVMILPKVTTCEVRSARASTIKVPSVPEMTCSVLILPMRRVSKTPSKRLKMEDLDQTFGAPMVRWILSRAADWRENSLATHFNHAPLELWRQTDLPLQLIGLLQLSNNLDAFHLGGLAKGKLGLKTCLQGLIPM